MTQLVNDPVTTAVKGSPGDPPGDPRPPPRDPPGDPPGREVLMRPPLPWFVGFVLGIPRGIPRGYLPGGPPNCFLGPGTRPGAKNEYGSNKSWCFTMPGVRSYGHSLFWYFKAEIPGLNSLEILPERAVHGIPGDSLGVPWAIPWGSPELASL